jgi:hypothetical protein
VLGRAQEVIDQAGVSTLDALHIASALVFQQLSGRRVPFIASDRRESFGAQGLGLEVTILLKT